jgi:NitT/TauT family transport system substrate-binding protein
LGAAFPKTCTIGIRLIRRRDRQKEVIVRVITQTRIAKKWIAAALSVAVMAVALFHAGPAAAQQKSAFNICWTIYVGWMPWGHMADTGILKKWADKYGIAINLVQINDYVESINQYTAGKFDGCTMTNMDALTIPAAGGVDSTTLIVGDFSNGNDGIVTKKGKTMAGLKGQKINQVEFSVSHYLLARALAINGMTERDVTSVNTSDADMVAAFATPDVTTVVTWNPMLSEVLAVPGASEVFNSSLIPGEIIDMMVVNTGVLKANPKLGQALVGAWFETIALMADKSAKGIAARTAMAKASGTDLAGFDAQLKTTKMFYTPAEAVAFTASPELVKTMDYVASFSFAHSLLGTGAKSKDAVGMAFPGGKTLGDTANIKLRFDPSYMEMAAQGKL